MKLQWISWVVSYAGRGVGKWTSNHRTSDGQTTLCGRKVPSDAFDVNHSQHPSANDCKLCQKAEARLTSKSCELT
ncbi:MAG: hypothetical protein ACREGR_04665 [Minisyncoccia bacterium]